MKERAYKGIVFFYVPGCSSIDPIGSLYFESTCAPLTADLSSPAFVHYFQVSEYALILEQQGYQYRWVCSRVIPTPPLFPAQRKLLAEATESIFIYAQL